MQTITQALAVVSILANGIVYGTDFFCAIVQRPALANVDDETLTATMGEIHRYGDRRMPIPGVVGLVTAAATTVIAIIAGSTGAAIAAGIAVVALLAWLAVYARISAPVNKQLTAAATEGSTPDNARDLQRAWDSVINLRVLLQLVAALALCFAVIGA